MKIEDIMQITKIIKCVQNLYCTNISDFALPWKHSKGDATLR